MVHSEGGQLHFVNPDAARAKLQLTGNLSGPHTWFSDRSVRSQLLVWSGLTAGILGLMVLIIPLLAEPIARSAPEPAHDWLGRQVLTAVEQQFGVCEDPEAEAVLAGFVDSLREESATSTEISLSFVEHEMPNALAAPGGNVVVFTGLMNLIEEPEELAAVVSHEIAHVEHRHPSSGLIRSMGFRFLASAVFGDFSFAAQMGHVLLNHSYTRENELEADARGVHYLNRAGYSSTGMKTAFERMQRSVGEQSMPYLSTHPSFDRRIDRLEDLVRSGDPPFTRTEWDRLRDLCSREEE